MMRPAELGSLISGNDTGRKVANLWDRLNVQRQGIRNEWKEQRNFVFATDTSKTSQSDNGWKNSTTIPKLTQIRDNLHSNYMSALFPNDDWLRWEAYNSDASIKDKANAIEAYMANKTRVGGFRKICSQLLYDYIDYGNAFAAPTLNKQPKQNKRWHRQRQSTSPHRHKWRPPRQGLQSGSGFRAALCC